MMPDDQTLLSHSFSISTQMYDRLKEKAELNDRSASYVVRELIHKWLNDDISIT